jgi:Tfp pilus assembly protein PilF
MTAILSLIVGVQQFVSRTRESVQRTREATTQIEIARGQASRGEFTEAWKSLDRAAALKPDESVDAARVDIGFLWLEDARPGPEKPFSVITDAVTPSLDRALLTAKGSRQADVLAHLGWAAFLRSRDGVSTQPDARYKEALAVDPTNAYANAMLGHWLMWNGGTVDAARERFNTALKSSGPRHAYARDLQLAALTNRQGDADDELLRVANQMRQGAEPLDSRVANNLYWVYTLHWGPSASQQSVPTGPAVSAADLESTYEWVLKTSDSAQGSPDQSSYVRAALQDAAGHRDAAIATFRSLQRPDVAPSIRQKAQKELTRLAAVRS